MTITASRDNPLISREAADNKLEQRFRDVGARALFEEIERLSDSVAGMSRRLADLERSTNLILALLDFPLPRQGELQTPIMNNVVVTASTFCNAADGFHGVEKLPDGTMFRWTGPQREFRFVVFVDRQQSCRGELTLLNSKRLSEGGEIGCYVDRNWVASQIVPAEDPRLIRRIFTLPARETNRGTEIVFVAPSVLVPRDTVAGSPDPRPLGVQFVELRVGGFAVGTTPQVGAGDVRQLSD